MQDERRRIMKNKQFNRYYLLSCLGVLVASYYPLSMGVRVITDMIVDGTVLKENYPKYIIPYTPMCIAIIIGVLLMPVCFKLFKRFALAGGGSIATAVFFAIELLFEQKVVVSTAETVTKLEDWQMFMCYIPPEGWGETVTTYKTQTAVDILMGDYSPAFKLHFYIIAIVLIITILNCLYGFGQMVRTGEKKRLKSLILQSACSLAFLGLCILACFTAFWRDGSIQVSPLSATLMTVFFILLGVTAGVFVGSFLLGKRKLVSIWIPSIVASVMTILMYVGEMFLLNGHLYRLGTGFLFDSIPGIVFAPIDLLVILLSGCITALIFALLNRERDYSKTTQKSLTIVLSVVCAVITLVIVLALCLGGASNNDSSISDVGGVDGPDTVYSTVKVTETKSDDEESSYEVSAYLPGTDFSSISHTLSDKIEQEWKTYDSMTREQQLASSKLWGMVGIQVNTWSECEETIGFAVNNPLESIDWLNVTGYFGMESADPYAEVKHILINADTAQSLTNVDRNLNEIRISSGYNFGKVKITLTAALCATSGTHTSGSVTSGYAAYEQKTESTGSGIPVLIVTTDEANNTGYYNGDYFDPTAYWVKDNVFYTLRVFGDEADRAEIQDILDRILAEI